MVAFVASLIAMHLQYIVSVSYVSIVVEVCLDAVMRTRNDQYTDYYNVDEMLRLTCVYVWLARWPSILIV